MESKKAGRRELRIKKGTRETTGMRVHTQSTFLELRRFRSHLATFGATRARSGQFIRGAAVAGVWAAKCEPCHIRFAASVLSMMRLGHCWHEDRTHEGAADGILVVQVRGVGTISREISQFAAREALIGFSAAC
jgi:hypothetical protein